MSVGSVYSLESYFYDYDEEAQHWMDDCKLPEETYIRTELVNTNFVFRGGKFIKLDENAPVQNFRKVYYTKLDKCLIRQGVPATYWGLCSRYKNPDT